MNSLIRFLKKNNLLLILALSISLLGCNKQPVATIIPDPFKDIVQGIKGKVLFKEGRFKSDGSLDGNGKIYGVERLIFIYELTDIKDVEIGEGDFVKYISTNVLDSAYSDKHGNFSKELPEGKYSLFVKEHERLFSKLGDQDIFEAVEVKKDKVSTITIEIDYKALYGNEDERE